MPPRYVSVEFDEVNRVIPREGLHVKTRRCDGFEIQREIIQSEEATILASNED